MSTNHSTLTIATIAGLIEAARYDVAMLNLTNFLSLTGDSDAASGIHNLLQGVIAKLGEAGNLLDPETESLD